MSRTTRRIALGAILAVPFAPVPAMAAPNLSKQEREFIALVPWLQSVVPEAEEAAQLKHTLYEAAMEKAGRWRHDETTTEHHARLRRVERAQRENGYNQAWERMTALEEPIGDATRELMGYPMTTPTAIAWKARLAILFDCWHEEALDDMAALVGRARQCA
ncbi:hypothetical protein [Methylorubrum suomiense]|uniref:Lysozyme inhibitor LprI N-terminal domain-containing protein n=1 Tax=Methylorubrum suomiense TaxID=144191 RepID=A0ABQ4V2Z0_9HYPH|nr:hypothetical protein [Methylorubrum suomiense]GJE77257.1 hypothetical protein BGCPKDLD_3860 [Methylorubrum suomiense]